MISEREFYYDSIYALISYNLINKKIKCLGAWISHQQKNYTKKEHIMKNEEIYNKWT
jgi:hypothetical protein